MNGLLLPIGEDPRVVSEKRWSYDAYLQHLGARHTRCIDLSLRTRPDCWLVAICGLNAIEPNPAAFALSRLDGDRLRGPVLVLGLDYGGAVQSLNTVDIHLIAARLLIAEIAPLALEQRPMQEARTGDQPVRASHPNPPRKEQQ